MSNNCIQCKKKPKAKYRDVCSGCHSSNWAANNPIIYSWHMLKSSAKRRNIEFSLTKKEFINFIKKTKYMELKGRLFDSLTIDRIKGHLGYKLGNIQILTKSENSSKYHTEEKDYPF